MQQTGKPVIVVVFLSLGAHKHGKKAIIAVATLVANSSSLFLSLENSQPPATLGARVLHRLTVVHAARDASQGEAES